MIRNAKNNKLYIGQSINYATRWRNHKQRARENERMQPLYIAMREDGLENFDCALIEQTDSNADDRERYWIEFFNTLVPNGYNVEGRYKHNAKLDELTIAEIKSLIRTSALPLKQIGKRFGVSEKFISAVNRGRNYFSPEETYPLRKKCNCNYEKLKQLHYDLKYSPEKSIPKLAKEYNMTQSEVRSVCDGEFGRINGNEYPLRGRDVKESGIKRLSYDQVERAEELLLTTSLSLREIGNEIGASERTIACINQGISHRKDEYNYPLRDCSNQVHKVCFSPNEVREIEHLLRDTFRSINSIAEQFHVGPSTIISINRGKTKKYRNDDTTYPIRQK